MEPIPSLIFNLLAMRRTVILPQVGTLRVEHTPASVHPKTGAIHAPENRVVFSREIAEGEALPEVIAQESGIDLRSVKPQYIRWAVELKRTLVDGKMFIHGVGTIYPDGTVVVSEELDRWLNPVEQKTIAMAVAPPPVTPKAPKVTKKTEPRVVKEEAPKKSGQFRGVWLTALISLIVSLILAGIYLYRNGVLDTWIDHWKKPAEISVAPVVTPELEIPVVVVDSLRTTPAAVVEDIAGIEPIPVEPLRGDSYHIIAGVYSTQQNAERFAREQGLELSKVEIFEMNYSGKYMVSVGRFETKVDADREKHQWESKFPEAWVMKRRQ